ncbi:MAG TPA: KGG domain-containing protein [Gemmatimonadaceae bacterium]|jgi:general stress protein YciG|nr:KGG domain-containing protein [Gemmatimonadaceae bacterium]
MTEQHNRDVASDDGRRGLGNGAVSGKRSGTSNRGFASMDRERQREIASKGGRAAHAKGTAHEWTADEARVAGRKGGETVSKDREHMAAIGREGGGARSAGARNRRRSENGETTVEDRSRVARSAPGDSSSNVS